MTKKIISLQKLISMKVFFMAGEREKAFLFLHGEGRKNSEKHAKRPHLSAPEDSRPLKVEEKKHNPRKKESCLADFGRRKQGTPEEARKMFPSFHKNSPKTRERAASNKEGGLPVDKKKEAEGYERGWQDARFLGGKKFS